MKIPLMVAPAIFGFTRFAKTENSGSNGVKLRQIRELEVVGSAKMFGGLKIYLIGRFLVRRTFHICPVWNRFYIFRRDLTRNYSQDHSKTFRIQAFHTSFLRFQLANHSIIFQPIREWILGESEARMKTFLVIDVAIKMFSSEFDLHLSCITCDLDTNRSAMISIRIRDKQPAVIWAIFLTIWLEKWLWR